ncbi:hypothetical protein ARAM_003218 [Aspergillus rambellii]|uniref:ML-like domain-containing protein n=1 Tax=Aspergillus rambellii TaxID=308745 RepID=A0A0F8WRI1_9EURO|nr:hypothetical protein ARAM_003218 [Aspergillus rambellii]
MSLDRDAKWHDGSRPTCASRPRGSELLSSGTRPRQLAKWCDTVRLRPRKSFLLSGGGIHCILVLLLVLSLFSPAYAALLEFDNCLDAAIIQSSPLKLQFVPLDVSVTFNLSDTLYPLNVTVYGNVSGTANQQSTYPAPDDPSWNDKNSTVGKIIDLDVDNNNYSTLISTVQVVSFTPYYEPFRFCDSLIHGDCPLGPVFYTNSTDLADLRAFSIQHDMLSSYRFSTLSTTLKIISGDRAADRLGCISVHITPDLGSPVKSALTFVPLAILILVGIATISAAIYSPWGTTDPFHWTSNYGRDEDVLRLVTPGFGDCLQYIQFAVLTGALSLNYPGYYQPVVSQAAWSVLMFNQSLTHPGTEQNPVVDGVYAVNGTQGLDRMEKYVGLPAAHDIWPGMMVWLLVILVIITLIIQLAFAFRWLYRELAHVPEEDLRAKNMPFTVGNVIRIVCNYFFLPIISFSFYQLVIAGDSPAYCVALAGVVIFILVCFSIWTVRLIVSARPKSYLFDDLPTVLLYGPLYNTFCDDAAAYAIITIFISFARGVAIGALQPSGIAQIVLLAICEVVSILTILAFRPFPLPSSMNLYHICFSIVRFLTILLCVVFVPSLGVSQAARGWIGYIILLLHGLVLVFGFFLNALQTLIEVVARLLGAGGNEGGVTRGGLVKVFGMRQLSRRLPRRDAGARQSMASDAAMLGHTDDRLSSQFEGSRPRSLSASSALLLNRAGASEGKISAIFESGSAHGTHSRANSTGLYTPTTLGGFPGAGYQTTGSSSPKSGPVLAMQPHDPYYRPPRPRRRMDRGFSDDSGRGRSSSIFRDGNCTEGDDDIIEGPSISGRATPVPAYIPAPKDELDYDEPRKSRKDYAVREVDFYYRVRGPPLSHTGTRKLKTGPADPTGPVSSATGFFRNLFRGKTKEKGKGFEVVRSTRAPPPGLIAEGEEFHEPYSDEPAEQDDGHPRRNSETDAQYQDSDLNVDNQAEETQISLPAIDSGGTIELPSRVGSRHSSQAPSVAPPKTPSITRQHYGSESTLPHQEGDSTQDSLPALTESGGRNASSLHPSGQLQPSSSGTGRLPFSATSSPSRDRNYSIVSTTGSTSSSHQPGNDETLRSARGRPSSMGYVAQHRTQDNIHQAHLGEPSFTESAAELVDEMSHTTEGDR